MIDFPQIASRLSTLLFCCMVFFVIWGIAIAADKPLSDLERMQGKWEMVALVEGSTDHVIFSADKVTFSVREKTTTGSFKIDATKQPKEIDLTFRNKDKDKDKNTLEIHRGLYDFRTDLLVICLGGSGESRPKNLIANDQQSLILLHRSKPK